MDASELTASIKAYASSHRNLVIAIVIALLLGAGGFVAGRYTSKPAVKETVRVETKTVTRVEYQDRVVEKKVYIQVAKKDSHIETTTTKQPDGTVITHTTEDSHVDEHASNTTDIHETKNGSSVTTETKIEVREKLVLKQPDWSVYAGVGIDIPYFLGQGQHGVPGLQGMVVQAGIDRRIVGPIWLGLFGNTEGVAGLNLRVTW